MTKDQLLMLIRAHAKGDADEFRRAALQCATHVKDGNTRDAIRRLVERDPELPRDFDAAWFPVDVAPRPWFPRSVASAIDELVDCVTYRVELVTRGVPCVSRVLVSGPPGCGKTMTARWLAKELGMSAYVLSLTGVVDSFMGGTASRIRKAMDAAVRVPAVWVLDEFDAISTKRSGASDGSSKERDCTVNALCIELDRIGVIPGIVVATTNRVDIIDPALLRRFDAVVEWPDPTSEDLAEFAAHVGASEADATYADTFLRAQSEQRRAALYEIRNSIEAAQ